MMMTGVIVKGVGGRYVVSVKGVRYLCIAKGLFRKKQLTPTVGDRVEITPISETTEFKANIVSILPRKTLLIRPPVANATKIVLVVGAANPDPNLRQLDKMIIHAERQGLRTVICINKIDLSPIRAEELSRIYHQSGYPVYCTDAASGEGVSSLLNEIKSEITAFSGPSGVGKSTLINYLVGYEVAEMGEISKKNRRGKHTTRHVELIELGSDTWIFDTPGFTSLDISGISVEKLNQYFLEFGKFSDSCKFSNCQHKNEPDCAVIAAVEQGKICKERYDSYLGIYEEIKNKEKY